VKSRVSVFREDWLNENHGMRISLSAANSLFGVKVLPVDDPSVGNRFRDEISKDGFC